MTLTKSNGFDGQILVASTGQPWLSHWKSSSDSPPAPGIQAALNKIGGELPGVCHQHSKIVLFLLSGGNIFVSVETLGVCFQLVPYPRSKRPREGTAVVGHRDGLDTATGQLC